MLRSFLLSLAFAVCFFDTFQPNLSLANTWSVFNDPLAQQKLRKLGAHSPQEMLDEIRGEDIKILVLASGRKTPPSSFTWSQVEETGGNLSEVTAQRNLMGKTLCQGEHALSNKSDTIVLADDAPRSTLLHEYLHILQIRKDRSWCQLSAQLWKRLPSDLEKREQLNREWDVVKTLWKNLSAIDPSSEDEITIAHETLTQSQKRESFDPEAKSFVVEEGIAAFLQKKIAAFQQAMRSSSKRTSKLEAEAASHPVFQWIDKRIFEDPQDFKNQAYCYFVFQEVIDSGMITPDLFAQYVKGGSLSLGVVPDYLKWLESKDGISCKKSVGEGFTSISAHPEKEYAVMLNQRAIKEEGHNPTISWHHEVLHIAFAKYRQNHDEIEKVWKKRPEKLKQQFKEKHVGYNFANKNILLREFFAYTFQSNLEAGLKILTRSR